MAARLVVVLLIVSLKALFPQGIREGEGAPAPTFEVASVREIPANAPRRRGIVSYQHGMLTLREQTLKASILWAYDVRDFDLSGPEWMEQPAQARFDVDAKAVNPVPESDGRLMLQALLAQRFNLAVHYQSGESMRMVMRVGKNGHKLKLAADGTLPRSKLDREGSRDVYRAVTMKEFITNLALAGTGVIYDQTGLTGRYDFELDYERFIDPSEESKPKAQADARLVAIREQLGLEIVKAKVQTRTLVIDHVDKNPSGN